MKKTSTLTMTIVEMRVHMDCPGCKSKIRKALQKLDGVDNVEIDMSMQKVKVTGYVDQEEVLETVRKTGRLVELWPFPQYPENYAFNYAHYDQFYQPPGSRFTVNPGTYHSVEPTYVDPNYDEYDNDILSTYNYHVHGNSGHDNGYYQEAPYTTVINERTSAMFSDENPHGCSIM